MIKRILLATDGSPVVEREILYAGHLARLEHAAVIVLHAFQPPAAYDGYDGYDQLVESYRSVAQAVVDDAINELRADGIEATGLVTLSAPAEAIINAAAEHDIDLVIMGTRGSSNLQQILGSVSTHVLRHIHCPVLQIP